MGRTYSVAESGHFTFASVIGSWGPHFIENVTSDAILYFDVVCVGSPVIIIL